MSKTIDYASNLMKAAQRLYDIGDARADAIKPVLREWAGRCEDHLDESWADDAHVEITLTVGELRRLHESVKEKDNG